MNSKLLRTLGASLSVAVVLTGCNGLGKMIKKLFRMFFQLGLFFAQKAAKANINTGFANSEGWKLKGPIGKFKGIAKVDNQLACEAELIFAIVDKPQDRKV